LDVRDIRGSPLDVSAECKAVYGPNAAAAVLPNRLDAYAWICRVPGQPDKGIDMRQACQRAYGDQAVVTLAGIGVYDWLCLRPGDVGGHLVPVLLFPREKLFDANERDFVYASLGRVDRLIGGVRRFYRERTSALVRGTNPFVLLSQTSATDWQNLALCTDQSACQTIGNPFQFPAGFDRNGYANRIKQELSMGGWDALVANSSVIVGSFVSLGASPTQLPTWCGALDLSGHYFVTAPSNSYAACSASTNNPPDYEDAFYGTGHEFGHAMELGHTNSKDKTCPDSYVYHDVDPSSNLLRPGNLVQSIMCLGNGTSSVLFPFEASRALTFLLGWH
jgi:hypothetical protein